MLLLQIKTLIRFLLIQKALTDDKDIDRLNYGVYFKYHQSFVPTTAIWTNTFAIHLPKFHAESIFPTDYSLHLQDLDLADITHRGPENSPFTACHDVKNADCPLAAWSHALGKKVAGLINDTATVIHQGITEVEHLKSAVNDLFKSTDSGFEGKKKRTALLPFMGDILKGTFGVSTEKDAEMLNSHMAAIAKFQNKENKAFNKFTTSMESYVISNNKRIDNLAEILKTDLVEDYNKMKLAISLVENETLFLNTVFDYKIKLTNAINRISHQYESILSATENLLNARLPSYLVPKMILQSTIKEIKKSLMQDKSDLRIIADEPSWYYRYADIAATKKDSVIFISLKFPLSSITEIFNLFEIINIPLPVDDKNIESIAHSSLLKDCSFGIMVNEQKTTYNLLNSDTLHQIKVNAHNKIFYTFAIYDKDNCEVSILRDDKHTAHKVCEYTLKVNGFNERIYRLNQEAFLVVANSPFKITCPFSVREVKHCVNCKVKLQKGCRINGVKFLAVNDLVEGTAQGHEEHLINLPLLMNFFDIALLNNVTGDTKTKLRSNFEIPKFEFFSEQSRRRLDRDKQLSIDLKTASTAVRESGLIVDNLDQPITIGDFPTTWTVVKALKEYAFLGSMVLSILSVMLNTYLIWKFRKLSVVVLSMSQNVDAKHLINLFELKYDDATEISANQWSLHDLVIAYQNEIWPYLAVSVIALIACIKCYKIVKNKVKFQCQRSKCYLVLKVSGRGFSVFVKLLKVPSSIAFSSIMADNEINNMQVKGIFENYVTFRWEDAVIYNPKNRKWDKIPKTARITVLQALLLTYILRDKEQPEYTPQIFDGRKFRHVAIFKRFEFFIECFWL